MHDGDTEVSPISAVVVAGGKSMRLGQDKRRLRLWGPEGPTMLERTVRLMAAHCDEVVVVLNDPEAWPGLRARLVPDLLPGSGSLGGIYSGLEAATHPYVFAVAGDMPFLNPALITWMVEQPRDYDVLVPRVPGESRQGSGFIFQTLHAIYRKSCLPAMRNELAAGRRQVIGFFPSVGVRTIEAETLRRFDPDLWSFFNANTPDAAAIARVHLADVARPVAQPR